MNRISFTLPGDRPRGGLKPFTAVLNQILIFSLLVFVNVVLPRYIRDSRHAYQFRTIIIVADGALLQFVELYENFIPLIYKLRGKSFSR